MNCLTLNASYEPLTLVPVERAIRLVIDEKAVPLEVDESRPYRSEDMEMSAPVVIRLVRYVHVPRRFRRQVTNTFLFARDEYRCQYCGRHKSDLGYRESLTRDHVVPKSRGGGNDWENVVAACSRCNRTKGDRLPRECGMELRTDPREPNHVQLEWKVRKVTPTQAKYIAMFYGEEVLSALTR